MKIVKILMTLLIIAAIIAVGALVYSSCAGQHIIQRIDKSEPDKAVAPFEVATESHIYLVERATLNDDKSVTITNWYNRENKKWVKYDGSITLPPLLKPRINKR